MRDHGAPTFSEVLDVSEGGASGPPAEVVPAAPPVRGGSVAGLPGPGATESAPAGGEDVGDGVAGGDGEVRPPVARYSTLNRSHRSGPVPRAGRREPGSGSAQPRNGGHRQQQEGEFSPASRRRSRTREHWTVRWPE